MIKNYAKCLLIIIFSINLISCSSFEKVEDWMRKNTKEYQEEQKDDIKVGKTQLKEFMSKSYCKNGSSSKILKKEKNGDLIYSVNCVRNSQKLIVTCNENGCLKN